ncbi:MAG TPA: sugar phosphate isomerase/epimerase family protein [Abditibacteriaceae bacterium]|nr:sugar phosphate isomerase/epimerase family protein [Abditibacteriaceae bacterium]
MVKSITCWAFDPSRPAAEVFRMAKDNGFEAVEVTVGEGGGQLNEPLTPQSTQDDCRRVAEQAQTAGIQISSVASGLGWSYPVTTTEKETARKGIEYTAQCLRQAQWLGTDAMLLVPGGVGADFIANFKGAPYDVAYDNALAAINELKPVAEETGVSIGVENVWNKFLLSPLEMRDFVDKVGSPRVGVYFDVGNVLLTGYAEQWIRILGSRIKRVHFKDFKRSIGTIDGFCDLLDGDVESAAVKATLREVGYDNAVTAEFFNCESDLPKISSAMDKILKM